MAQTAIRQAPSLVKVAATVSVDILYEYEGKHRILGGFPTL